MARPDGRKNDQIRQVKLTAGYIPHVAGSVLIQMGSTHVLCNASIENSVPPHLKGSGSGWVTAEYSLLPCATQQRTKRERGTHLGGRTQEIQRLIGRSLRSVIDHSAIGEKTIMLDCDVLQADGGTRTASITGAFVAMSMAAAQIKKEQKISKRIIQQYLASISVGVVKDIPCLDLCYEEDFNAMVDMNVVMVESGDFVEIQGSGEESTFTRKETNAMFDLAEKGIKELINHQREILKDIP